MREVQYLSPTSIALWAKNKDEFYLNYLATERAPRFPQTKPMSIGSSFDAYTKSFLHQALFGVNNDPKFAFQTLFEAQVEPQNRDWAIIHGKHAFEEYKKAGALSDLMLELQSAIGSPRFELDVKGAVEGHREGITKNLGPVTFLGKPDVFYINKAGTYVILDFKVNGWCSTRTTSPMAGYCKLRSSSGARGGQHKDCQIMMWGGQMINVAHYLEQLDDDWARQLSIYGWLCGMNVGQPFIVAIDQLVCSPSGLDFPLVRIAEHRLRVSLEHQWKVFAEAEELWYTIKSGHIFQDMPREESDAKCRALEKQALALSGKGSPEDMIFATMTRGARPNY